MAQKLEQGSIIFIDVPTQIPDISSSKGTTLLPLLDLIRNHIGELRGDTPYLLVFDELALFQWIGHEELDVSRFARALVSSCVKVSTNNPTIHSSLPASSTNLNSIKITPTSLQNDVFLAIRYHIAAPDDLDNTVRILLQLSTYHIEVLPLSSGKSGAVSGEVRTGSLLVACSASFLKALP